MSRCGDMATPLPRAISSREWTDYVLQINSSPTGPLKRLHGLWLRPSPKSTQPLYRTGGGPSVLYVHFGIPDIDGSYKGDGWTLSERPHGQSQQATILATLPIGQNWPRMKDNWKLEPEFDDSNNSLVVNVVHETEYEHLCNMVRCSWSPEEQDQFQKALANLDTTVVSLQHNQKFLTEKISQVAGVVEECQANGNDMAIRVANMEKDVAQLHRAQYGHHGQDRLDRNHKCTCSRKPLHYNNNISRGDIVAVLDEKTGYFDDMGFEYYNRDSRSVKVRNLKGSNVNRPRYVRDNLVFTWKSCSRCLRNRR
jgi:hypothetical protein